MFALDLPAYLGVEMSGFSHDRFGDPFVQLAGDELAVGVRQLKPQRSRSVEAAFRGDGGDAAGEADLFGNAATDSIRMHLSGDLLRHLRLSKPNRLCSLQRRGG